MPSDMSNDMEEAASDQISTVCFRIIFLKFE